MQKFRSENSLMIPLLLRSHRLRSAVLAFCILHSAFCIFCLPGCRKSETPVEAGNREQILHLGNGAEPRDLDPTIAVSTTESHILVALYEGLVSYSPDARSVLPGAAERWDISPDGKTYTFHLRPGLKWSNGDPLTSEDFLYSFRRIAEPALGAETANYLDPVVGCLDFREGRSHDPGSLGFRAHDAQTFEITLQGRAPYFLGLLANYPFYPLHRPSIEKLGARLQRGGAWTRPGVMVTNGPFRLKEWRVNDALVVEKNPNYRDADHVRLKAVVFHPVDNLDTEERNFRGGLLHVTRNVPVVKLDDYRKQKSPFLKADPLVSTKYLTFNVAKPPLNDVRVREAFAWAVDRTALVEQVIRDGSRPADSLSVPGSGSMNNGDGYRSRTRLAHDPEKARAALADAGFPQGKGFPKVELVFTGSHPGEQGMVEALQAMWQRELGVHVDLVEQEEKVWLDTLRTKNFQLLIDGWSAAVNDPVDMFQLFVGNSPNNDAGWVNPAYDTEFAAAANAPDDTERELHLQTMDAVLIQQLPIIPLFYRNQNYLVQGSVQGWKENMLDWHPFQAISLGPPPPAAQGGATGSSQ